MTFVQTQWALRLIAHDVRNRLPRGCRLTFSVTPPSTAVFDMSKVDDFNRAFASGYLYKNRVLNTLDVSQDSEEVEARKAAFLASIKSQMAIKPR